MWGGLCGNAPSCHTAETMCLWMRGELRGGMPPCRCFARAAHPRPEQQPRAQRLREQEGRRAGGVRGKADRQSAHAECRGKAQANGAERASNGIVRRRVGGVRRSGPLRGGAIRQSAGGVRGAGTSARGSLGRALWTRHRSALRRSCRGSGREWACRLRTTAWNRSAAGKPWRRPMGGELCRIPRRGRICGGFFRDPAILSAP